MIRFTLTFKRGPKTVAVVEGHPRELEGLHIGDVTDRVMETEAYLERLTGLRVHVESTVT